MHVYCNKWSHIKSILSASTILIYLILTNAHASEPFLGLQIQGLSPQIRSSLNLKDTEGVLIRNIAFPGPASTSDLNRGDVLIKLNGVVTKRVDQVVKLIATLTSVKKVRATVIRRGKRINVTVTVGEKQPAWNV